MVILGHFYMLKLLLAVIMANLTKIQAQEAYEEISRIRSLVELDKQNKEDDL